jgi:hypothetical protein
MKKRPYTDDRRALDAIETLLETDDSDDHLVLARIVAIVSHTSHPGGIPRDRCVGGRYALCELCGEPAGEGGAICPACVVNHRL